MQKRSRGLYDMGLSEGAATLLRSRGENPAEWTVMELVDSRGRVLVASLLLRVDAEAPDTRAAFFTWLNARDAFLQAM